MRKRNIDNQDETFCLSKLISSSSVNIDNQILRTDEAFWYHYSHANNKCYTLSTPRLSDAIKFVKYDNIDYYESRSQPDPRFTKIKITRLNGKIMREKRIEALERIKFLQEEQKRITKLRQEREEEERKLKIEQKRKEKENIALAHSAYVAKVYEEYEVKQQLYFNITNDKTYVSVVRVPKLTRMMETDYLACGTVKIFKEKKELKESKEAKEKKREEEECVHTKLVLQEERSIVVRSDLYLKEASLALFINTEANMNRYTTGTTSELKGINKWLDNGRIKSIKLWGKKSYGLLLDYTWYWYFKKEANPLTLTITIAECTKFPSVIIPLILEMILLIPAEGTDLTKELQGQISFQQMQLDQHFVLILLN